MYTSAKSNVLKNSFEYENNNNNKKKNNKKTKKNKKSKKIESTIKKEDIKSVKSENNKKQYERANGVKLYDAEGKTISVVKSVLSGNIETTTFSVESIKDLIKTTMNIGIEVGVDGKERTIPMKEKVERTKKLLKKQLELRVKFINSVNEKMKMNSNELESLNKELVELKEIEKENSNNLPVLEARIEELKAKLKENNNKLARYQKAETMTTGCLCCKKTTLTEKGKKQEENIKADRAVLLKNGDIYFKELQACIKALKIQGELVAKTKARIVEIDGELSLVNIEKAKINSNLETKKIYENQLARIQKLVKDFENTYKTKIEQPVAIKK